MHVEKISFKPTGNLEFGFTRSVIWGGQGHVPITIGSFFHSFFSFQNVSDAEKFSRNDRVRGSVGLISPIACRFSETG
jgi:hypothetical protein